LPINKSLLASDKTQSNTLTEKLTASVVSLFRLQREKENDHYCLGEIRNSVVSVARQKFTQKQKTDDMSAGMGEAES